MDSLDKKRVADFLKSLRDIANWLDKYFSDDDLPVETKRRVLLLRDYLKHCRRRVQAGECEPAVIYRRRDNISDSCLVLWELARSRN